MTGLTNALVWRVVGFSSKDPAGDVALAEKTIDAHLALEPDNPAAHAMKGWVYFAKRQWGQAMAEEEIAIAVDRNNADAHAAAGLFKMFLGHSEDGFAGLETALRLSPRDRRLPNWQHYICHLHTHLAQWGQAIEWCNKARAGSPGYLYPLIDLAAANAWAGHHRAAQEAATQLQKVNPGFTVQTWAGIHWTDDPTFNAQYARIAEGLRKAGLPGDELKRLRGAMLFTFRRRSIRA
jgi:adenylate cyclase